MAGQNLHIHHGGRQQGFALPEGWTLGTFARFAAPGAPFDLEDGIARALARPVGSDPLGDRVKDAQRVALLVEDLTRRSPKRAILAALLNLLHGAGVPAGRIDIVIALGTHRPLSQAELESAFGRDLVRSHRFLNHDCHAADLVPVGRLPSGVAVRINRIVAEADLKIGIGSIFPHPMNGFGGGGKILFPGVADIDSIREHHFRLTFHPQTTLGNLDGNLFHREVCEIARKARLDFIVNSVMDSADQACAVVAGAPEAAHRAGIDICRAAISHRFPEKADVTLISAFPYDEGPQTVKALIPAAMVTRPGGVILWAVDCPAGLPEPFLESFAAFHRAHAGRLAAGVLEHFNGQKPIMPGGAVDYNMALGLTLALLNRFRIVMISRDISALQAEKIGVRHAPDLAAAFEIAAGLVERPTLHVIPSGGVILPVLI